MSPDLVALGDQIEDAVRRAVERRRARRQAVLNAAATFMIALPLALAAANADLSSPERSSIGAAGERSVLQWTPDYSVAGSRLPAQRGPRIIPTVRCPERFECAIKPGPTVPPSLKRMVR